MIERIQQDQTDPEPRAVTLRRATAEDLSFLFRVSTEAMRPVVETLNPAKIVDSDEEFKAYEAKFKPEEIDVVQYEGTDVGRLRVVRTAASIYIGGLQILPEFQDMNIGRTLLSELIEESNRSGIPITLEVHDVNTKALSSGI